jgi:hypothetical protein
MKRIIFILALVLGGCGGQAKTNTAQDAANTEAEPGHSVSAEHEMPESPKVRADDMEHLTD